MLKDLFAETLQRPNRQLRKSTKGKSILPSDESLLKMLYLDTMDVLRKWTTRVQNWGQTLPQLAIHFQDRVDLHLRQGSPLEKVYTKLLTDPLTSSATVRYSFPPKVSLSTPVGTLPLQSPHGRPSRWYLLCVVLKLKLKTRPGTPFLAFPLLFIHGCRLLRCILRTPTVMRWSFIRS